MENNGRGIFYGVIGVATLVVAIIGATFAYFSASVTGNQAVTAGGAQVSLNWSDTGTEWTRGNLVPVETGIQDTAQAEPTYKYNGATYNADTLKTSFAGWENLKTTVGEAKWCTDGQGYNICSVYSITVENPGSVAVDLEGTFNTVSNTAKEGAEGAMKNLKFAIFRGSIEQVAAKGWNVNGTAKTSYFAEDATDGDLLVEGRDVAATGINDVDDKLNINLGADGTATDSATFTIMMWIEEIGEQQEDGGSFTGRVDFTTASGTGVTGLLVAGE